MKTMWIFKETVSKLFEFLPPWVDFLRLVWPAQIKLMFCYFTHITCSFCFTHNNSARPISPSIPLKAKTNQQVTLIASCHRTARRSSRRSSDWLKATTVSGQCGRGGPLILDETLMVRLEAYPDCRLFRNIYIEKVSVIISPVLSLSMVQDVVSC